MRIQPKKIMCAVDFSNFTKESLGYGVALCKKFNAKLLLAHIVIDVNAALGIERVMLQDEQIPKAQNLLEDMVKEGAIEYQIIVRKGDPADEICHLAQEEEVDIVVTATHGESGIKRLLIGSVTEKLIKTLPCPLIILQAREHHILSLNNYEMKLEKILVGCDFSPDSRLAFDYALSLAQEFQTELYLTHVINPKENIQLKTSDYINVLPGDYVHWDSSDYFEMQKKVTAENRNKIENLRKRLEKQLYFMLPEDCKHWCTPHITLLTGEPYKELIKYAKEQKIDMIVLGIHGHTLWERLMVGSTTDRVIRATSCPVLAVRQIEG